jgi:2-polyprenyl-6-hydroxyphenyl methylase/3-demethylubiquinone-9 3-methyltransferase
VASKRKHVRGISVSYEYLNEQAAHTQSYLLPTVLSALEKHVGSGARLFELGCGNGANAAALSSKGYRVTGVDPSCPGIAIAHEAYPSLDLHVGATDLDLSATYGTFDVVLSLEVVEHVFSPRQYSERVRDLLNPGGIAIISTPYHSYLKNLALAVTGKMDTHFTALWEGGHIKFWSRRTLGELFATVGMREIAFNRVGRIPCLAKSMVITFKC